MWMKLLLLASGPASGVLGQNFATRDGRCRSDLEKITEGLAQNQIWAYKILDSWSKLPSGVLTGHFVDYGNYDECLRPGGDVRTQHCIASVAPAPAPGRGAPSPPFVLRWSFCLPASCPPEAVETLLGDAFRKFSLNVSVAPSDCTSKGSKSISTGDRVGISIWGAFVGLAVLSTVYDVVVEDGRKSRWLSSFSVYTNGRNLLKMDVSPETLLPLHGIRFLSICWVVLGHRYFFTASSSLLNFLDFAEELRKPESQFFVQAVLAVDTFFLLSGLLNCYHLLNLLDTLKTFPIARYYIHRYIRLTPALAAVVVMYATWYPLIGDGPAWHQTTAIWKQLCVDHWLPTLLYINNYYNPTSQCAGQSWYLAVDMQLYWLSPLVVLPLRGRPRMGRLLLWGLLALSTALQFFVAFVYKFRMSFTFGLSLEEMEKVMKLIYVPTHTRATPYVVGIMIGEFLYRMRKERTRVVFSKGFLLTGWFLSTMVGLGVVFGNFQFSRPLSDHPYDRWESSLYIALHRVGWGAAVGWIIVVCSNEQGGIINGILSFKVFVPLSRLTYCIFLSHMAVQQFQIGTARTSDYFQSFDQVHRYFGDLVFSVIAAGGLTLLFESPILVLEKLTGGGKPQERNLKSEVNNGFRDDSIGGTHEI